jgi:hypothetical protein
MLHELDVLETRTIADLASDARNVRNRLLEKIADADLGEPIPARGQHNPGGGIALDEALAAEPEYVALRDALVALPRDIKEKILVVTQIGRGDLAILDWSFAREAASALPDDDIVATLLDEPDLHDLLHKGLYVVGAATLPADTAQA